jgi:cytoskeletal protein RodZ
MDETVVDETDVPSVGEQLRVAREAKGLSLEDVAAQTRIPRRHLESIETSDWDKLPAPTYTIGFAKSYASAVGLERSDIGEQLRSEMGGQRMQAATAEVFEPADPARTMPKGLVIGAIAAVIILLLLMTWLNNRSLQQPDEPTNTVAAAEAPTQAPPPAAAPAPTAGQPGVHTASQPGWQQVSERGGAVLYSGMMAFGQTYAVPQTATAPVLKTGKPEALRITVGNSVAPPVGPAATTVNNVSLLPADLMRAGPAAAPATAAPAPAPSTPAPRAAPPPRRQTAVIPAPAPAPVATPVETPPATSNTGA